MEGGMPFGFSTFSSFGHDKTRFGWTAGIYGGYRFNPIFSAELTAKYGKMNLAAQKCCAEQGYWLGSDGVLYKASVLGMDSWEYANLKSRIQMGQYGARLNVNLLGFFPKTANSRWEVAVSPHAYAVSTQANIQSISDGTDVAKGTTNWHFGYGADLQVSSQLTSCLRLGIYSGLTRLTGSRTDGMPTYLHKNNFVWESGIRLGFNLYRKRKNNAAATTSTNTPIYVPQEKPAPTEDAVKEEPTNKAETKITTTQATEQAKEEFPVIYFEFNSVRISPTEESKLHDLLKQLKEHDDAKVTITGWCDTKGSTAVNKRISLQRAQAVKTWLVKNGIEDNRITTIGNGSDYEATSSDTARRAETTKNIH